MTEYTLWRVASWSTRARVRRSRRSWQFRRWARTSSRRESVWCKSDGTREATRRRARTAEERALEEAPSELELLQREENPFEFPEGLDATPPAAARAPPPQLPRKRLRVRKALERSPRRSNADGLPSEEAGGRFICRTRSVIWSNVSGRDAEGWTWTLAQDCRGKVCRGGGFTFKLQRLRGNCHPHTGAPLEGVSQATRHAGQ